MIRPLFIGLLLLAWASAVHAQAPVESTPTTADLESAIEELRSAKRFQESADAAGRLVALARKSEMSPMYIDVVEELQRELLYVASLPSETQDVYLESMVVDSQLRQSFQDGAYADGVRLGRRLLEMRTLCFPEEHHRTLEAVSNLAVLLLRNGEADEALELFKRTLTIARSIFQEPHWEISLAINNVASTLDNLGFPERAIPLFREALSMRQELFGEVDARVGTSLQDLASAYETLGDYQNAEILSREALQITRQVLPEGDPQIAVASSNLGNLLGVAGNPERARDYYDEALHIYRAKYGKAHPNIAITIDAIGHLDLRDGRLSEAEDRFTEALAMREELLGEHPYTSISIGNLAAVRAAQGDLARARKGFAMAEAQLRDRLGEGHIQTARAQVQLGRAERQLGLLDAAEGHLAEGLATLVARLGAESADAGGAFQDLGLIRHVRGDWAAAESLLTLAAAAYDGSRAHVPLGFSRAMFRTPPHARLAAERVLLGRGREGWEAAERGSGRVLWELVDLAGHVALSEEQERSRTDILHRLANAERKVNLHRSTDEGIDSAEFSATSRELHDVATEWARWQNQAAQTIPAGRPFSLERVQAALDETCVIVGWVDADLGGGNTASWAWLIGAEKTVEWFRLPEEGTASEQELKTSIAEPWLDPGPAARAVWSARFGPIEDRLQGIEQLIVVPSGPMMGVPIEVLQDDQGRSVLDRFQVTYAPSATLWAALAERPSRAGAIRALLVGDPPHSPDQKKQMTTGEAVLIASLDETQRESGAWEGILRGNDESLRALRRLPQARREVESISSRFSSSELLLGPDASEQALSAMADGDELKDYGLIHFATHAAIDDERPERSAIVLSQVDLPDPYVAAVRGARVFDGLLSTREIMTEWRLDADLVTLSGCETALGRATYGEGFLGFGHGLFQAGARSILVSLWKVEDSATALLMEEFYEFWLGDGGVPITTKTTALRRAKQACRDFSADGGSYPYAHPAYWAGFVLVGDSR
ncbi:MAG: hypothetical protein DHS20C21_00030 [Gemmatimonadota bacterium]|nr:MAG: hypothetical protein DHS20C21_00030 [Gemmatimonadota bacterium]